LSTPIVPDVLAHKGAPLRGLRSDPCRLRATGPPEAHKEPIMARFTNLRV